MSNEPGGDTTGGGSWRELETPFERGQLLELPGARLWVHDEGGEGEPLFLMGGFSPGHFHFDFVRPHLRDFRLITWEPHGFGPSLSPPRARYSAAGWATDLRQVLEGLGISRAHIWANGFSSYVALRLAADSPEMVGALVVSTDVWAGDPTKGYQGAWEAYRKIIEAAGTTGRGAELLAELYQVTEPAWFGDWFATACARVLHAETLNATRYCLLEADVRDALGEIAAPTLALLGDRDWNGAPLQTEDDPSLALMRSELAGIEVAVVGAHPIHLIVQRPREAAAIVDAFIRRSA